MAKDQRSKSKRHRKILSLKDKLKILKAVDSNLVRRTDVAVLYGIPSSTLSTIIKNRKKLELEMSTYDINPNRMRLRMGIFDELEKKLFKWYKKSSGRNCKEPPDSDDIREMATKLAQEDGLSETFVASTNWYFRFKNRYNIGPNRISKKKRAPTEDIETTRVIGSAEMEFEEDDSILLEKAEIEDPDDVPQQPGNFTPMIPTQVEPEPPLPEACVRWNGYQSNIQSSFPRLLEEQRFVDVTLACEGKSIKCHQVILAACSPYFDELLAEHPCQHPIVILRGIQFWEIQSLVAFMYNGEINVGQEQLPSLLAAAEVLKIKGLASCSPPFDDMPPDHTVNNASPPDTFVATDEVQPRPHVKRVFKRRSVPLPMQEVFEAPGMPPSATDSTGDPSAFESPVEPSSDQEASGNEQTNLPSSSNTTAGQPNKQMRTNKWRRVRLAMKNALGKQQGVSNPAIKTEPESEVEADDVEFKEDFETFEMPTLGSSLDLTQADKSIDPLSHTPPDDYGPIV